MTKHTIANKVIKGIKFIKIKNQNVVLRYGLVLVKLLSKTYGFIRNNKFA